MPISSFISLFCCVILQLIATLVYTSIVSKFVTLGLLIILFQTKSRNANRGAWIKRSDYPRATGVIIEGNAAEGYIIPVQSAASIRLFDNPRVYLSPIGPDQIKLYKDQGVDLTQNPGW